MTAPDLNACSRGYKTPMDSVTLFVDATLSTGGRNIRLNKRGDSVTTDKSSQHTLTRSRVRAKHCWKALTASLRVIVSEDQKQSSNAKRQVVPSDD